MQKIIIQESQTWTQMAVSLFLEIATEAIERRGAVSVALSGGSTPEPIYRALSKDSVQKKIDWRKMHLFWGDERNVPPNHTDSNFHMVNQLLLKNIPIPADNVHRVLTELDVVAAAEAYEMELKRFFPGDWPRFDLVLLGMGADGHTASLFPYSDGLQVEDRWFISNFALNRKIWRLTLTKKAINAARNIIIMINGAEKASMVAEVLKGEDNPQEKPIQFIKPTDGQLIWLLDEQVASKLPSGFSL